MMCADSVAALDPVIQCQMVVLAGPCCGLLQYASAGRYQEWSRARAGVFVLAQARGAALSDIALVGPTHWHCQWQSGVHFALG